MLKTETGPGIETEPVKQTEPGLGTETDPGLETEIHGERQRQNHG